jgi:hypothetical protein
LILLKSVVQLFREDIFFRSSSADFGSFQKSGLWVIASFPLMAFSFPSMSKIPP